MPSKTGRRVARTVFEVFPTERVTAVIDSDPPRELQAKRREYGELMLTVISVSRESG